MQMGDGFDHPVEKVAVVTDQDDGAGIIDQIVFKPDGGFKIKVVGRLIKQQKVRAKEQGRGQGDTHPPAAREIIAGALLGIAIKTKTREDRCGTCFGGVRINIGKAGVNLGNAVGVCGGFGFFEKGCPFGVRSQNRFK